jgi:hypothetical protein
MFIKVNRTQVGTSGTYRAGVVYKIDEQDPMQSREAKAMVKSGFAVVTTKKEFDALKAAASKAPSGGATKGKGSVKNEPASDTTKAEGASTKEPVSDAAKGEGAAKSDGNDTEQNGG